MTAKPTYTLQLSDVSNTDAGKVGGKNASLGEMIQHLQKAGIRVPGGFATTAQAYWYFLDSRGLREQIGEKLAAFANGDASLDKTGKAIRRQIRNAGFPDDLADAIRSAYADLAQATGEKDPPSAALRKRPTGCSRSWLTTV